MTSFLWYDYETWGLNVQKDRPSQFAAVRTDENLNVVGEPIMLYNRPTWDVLPSVDSVLLTGITPQECLDKGVDEFTFARRVHEEMNRPGTISLGYNTQKFDNNVNRFLFWRHGLSAYTHEYANRCGAWDLFPLMTTIYALRGEVDWMRWPRWEDGWFPNPTGRTGVCFKLEAFSKANGLLHDKAHDALSDVYATIALARLIREHEPKLWAWALENRTKFKIQDKIQAATKSGAPLLWASPRLAHRGYATFVLPVSSIEKNGVFLWDLADDPTTLLEGTVEEAFLRLNRRKAEAEGVTPLSLYEVKINASPFLCEELRVLRPSRRVALGMDEAAMARHAAWLMDNQAAVMERVAALRELQARQWETNQDECEAVQTLVRQDPSVTPALLERVAVVDSDTMLYGAMTQDRELEAWQIAWEAGCPTESLDWTVNNPWLVGTYAMARLRHVDYTALSTWEQHYYRLKARTFLDTLEAYEMTLGDRVFEEEEAGATDSVMERLELLTEWTESVHESLYETLGE